MDLIVHRCHRQSELLFFCLLLDLNEPNTANRFSEFTKFLNIQMSSIIHILLPQAYVQDVRSGHMGTSQQMVFN